LENNENKEGNVGGRVTTILFMRNTMDESAAWKPPVVPKHVWPEIAPDCEEEHVGGGGERIRLSPQL